MKCNQSRPGFELVLPCPFPMTITITPQAPPLHSYTDNTVKAPKKICGMKGEGEIDHNTVTRGLKKFRLGCKNLNDKASLGRAENHGF